MEKRTIVGLMVLAVIAAIAMFSGCVEEKVPTSTQTSTTPTYTLELTPTPKPTPTPIKYNVTIDSATGSVSYSSEFDYVVFYIIFEVTNHESTSTPALEAEIHLTQPHHELDMRELDELGEIEPHETKLFTVAVWGDYSDYEDYNPFKYTSLEVSVYDPSQSYPFRAFDSKHGVINSAI